MSPRVAAYETFLRRIIRTVPGAALLAVAAFDFELFDASMPDSQGQPTGISVTRPKAYFDSGETRSQWMAGRWLKAATDIGGAWESQLLR
ncbi:hypothetical protein OEZ86_007505 [Tetradesmus obliquus]|nr:hypothetical protein OEZ86_007505 [Tetradesmus obliquus]